MNPSEKQEQLLDEALQRIVDEGLEKVLPSRRKGEDKKKFVSRCMGDAKMRQEFPDASQRAAVCNRQAGK